MRIDVARAHVENLLRQFLEVPTLTVDDDGDIPIRSGSMVYFVRIVESEPHFLTLFAPIVRNVAASPELYERLNEINALVRWCRIYWQGETIYLETELIAETVDAEELARACGAISHVGDAHDDELAARFGGDVFFEDSADSTAV